MPRPVPTPSPTKEKAYCESKQVLNSFPNWSSSVSPSLATGGGGGGGVAMAAAVWRVVVGVWVGWMNKTGRGGGRLIFFLGWLDADAALLLCGSLALVLGRRGRARELTRVAVV